MAENGLYQVVRLGLEGPMDSVTIAQPDVTLHLDMEGVIKDASLSDDIPERGMTNWHGKPWSETVAVTPR